jgi:hypothetical protein
LEQTIQENLGEGWSVAVLSTLQDLMKTADQLASSSILIGNHISNLIHMVWLAANITAVIDLSSVQVSCNSWARQMAAKLDVQYFRGSFQEDCECANWTCYPQGPEIRDAEIAAESKKAIDLLKEAMKFVEEAGERKKA